MIFHKLFHMERTTSTTYLITGLGNPGVQYRHTRHNVGFMVLDHLAKRLGVTFSRLESKALVQKADYQSRRMVLAKPQTFMNLSGGPVSSLARYYKVAYENILICYDEVDLPLGTLRLRPGGGSAGHRGMSSVIEKLGNQEFPRMRIGINRPPGRMEAADYVLQDFSAYEKELLNITLESAVDAILLYVIDGLDAAMNKFNGAA
jgi:peptidyl-tRNA hydrolase, PTH1 family